MQSGQAVRIGSLFSGIGGLELGLERAGVGETVWQVEQNKWCREVLAQHWPNAERFEDVREVGAHNLAPVDVICGGFPCQNLSLAGNGEGLAGEKSGLWWEYARIVREMRPRWVVIENVSALRNRGLDAVLWEMASLGYDALWDCIPAAAIGTPHRRDRLFMVAWRVSDAERDTLREEPGRGSGSGDGASAPFAEHLGAVMAGRGWPPAPDDADGWSRVPVEDLPATVESEICGVADGVSKRLARARARQRREALKGYGNAVVPQVAEVIGRYIMEKRNG